MENFQTDYISVINSILLLVDYQPKKVDNIISGSRSGIKNAVVAAAKAAGILNVPVIMTSADESAGEFIHELTDIFPRQEVIKRSSQQLSALSNERVRRSIRRYSREKLIVSGLWTSESFLETAVDAVREGYEVFGLTDASGDTSVERQNFGINRMLRAGVTPITWMSLASEWMNGWAVPAESDIKDEVSGKYNAMLSYLAKE